MQDLLLSDVTPLPMGLEYAGGTMNKIVGPALPSPLRRLKPWLPMRTTSQERSSRLSTRAAMTEDNNLLGSSS